MTHEIHRRTLFTGTVSALTLGGLAACSTGTATTVSPTSEAVRRAEQARRGSQAGLVTARLTPRRTRIDLGGRTVSTWAYGDTVPGPLIRATAGDRLQVSVHNQLPDETSVHFHGIALRNDMDGVPGVTQDPIASGGSFDYSFTVPDPGTYFYHPHVGVQLDRGLYGVLVVDDPAEPGRYDDEWIVVLDDWLDGTGRTPDEVLADLTAAGASSSASGGMAGMDGMGGMGNNMGGMGGKGSSILGDAGDVTYPYFLVNGRSPADPTTFRARAGQRVRIRFVNAGTDTAFRVALGGHRLTVTHSDGYPVQPLATDALIIGMGERYDVVVTLRDGVFPLVASAEGKHGQALALVRTGSGRPPTARVHPAELDGLVLLGTDFVAASSVRLASRDIDTQHDLVLSGSMSPYRWTINGRSFPDIAALEVQQGERVRLVFANHSMMSHPMHLHGHTFEVDGGARKDTVIVRPMQQLVVDLDANNPGQWMTHCHNLYHAETGMMTVLSYRT